MRGLAPLALLLAAAGCGDGGTAAETNEELANQIERIAEAPKHKEVVPRPPDLEAIGREEIERELAPGAGCDLSQDGRYLLVAVTGDAIAKVRGRIVHLRADGPVGPTGGFFRGPGITISVGRKTDTGRRIDEVTSWPAEVAILAENIRERNRLEAVWSCGA